METPQKSKREVRAEKQAQLREVFKSVVESNLRMLSNAITEKAFEDSIQTVHDELNEDQVRAMAVNMFNVFLIKESGERVARMAERIKSFHSK